MMTSTECPFPPVLPTGSLYLDLLLKAGGLPRGVIAEIFGGASSGKSTLALHILSEAQRLGLVGLYIDLENSFTLAHARACGLDPQKTLLAEPRTGECALEISLQAIQGGAVPVVVLDTIAALSPRAEIGRSAPAGGEINQLIAPAFRRLKSACRQHRSTLICLNQLRTRLRRGYGAPETTPGGMALRLQADVRIRLQRSSSGGPASRGSGVRVLAAVEKGPGAGPTRSTFFNIVYNRGINKEIELVSLGINQEIITRKGSHYHFRNRCLGKNRREMTRTLRAEPDMAQSLERYLRRTLFPDIPFFFLP